MERYIIQNSNTGEIHYAVVNVSSLGFPEEDSPAFCGARYYSTQYRSYRWGERPVGMRSNCGVCLLVYMGECGQ